MKFRQMNAQNFTCDYDVHSRSISVGPCAPLAQRPRIQLYAHEANEEVIGIRLNPDKARRLAARLIELADAAEREA